MYTDKVMQHFLNPKNMGTIEKPDGAGIVGNPVCGDIMKIYIKIKSKIKSSKSKITNQNQKSIFNLKNKYISDIKFQTLGCGAAIATSSMITEMVKGKTLEEALKITNKDVAKKLGGLPKAKIHCSMLAVDGVQKAIEDYKKKNG